MTTWLRGHPAILLPTSQTAAYPGDDAERPGGPVAAYPIQGEGYAGLAVHDPEATTFVPTDDGGLLAQLLFSDGPADALEALAPPDDGWDDLGFEYVADVDESVLFESYYPGTALDDPDELEGMAEMDVTPIRCALPAGRYRVASCFHLPDARTRWLLVRLTRS